MTMHGVQMDEIHDEMIASIRVVKSGVTGVTLALRDVIHRRLMNVITREMDAKRRVVI